MRASVLSRAVGPLVDFVYPPRCPLCGEGIASGPGLCSECWSELELPGEPACARCQIPLPSAAQGCVCDACRGSPPDHAGVAAAAMYNESARQLVLRFKHGKRIGLAKLMGRLIAGRLGGAPPDALLVPVPLHRIRLWTRGFNQAVLLAREVARYSGHAVVVDALKRTRATPMLGGLGRVERAKIMRKSIVATRKGAVAVQGRDVILVDDVLTSGATSGACTRALLDAGARSVRIACFARVKEGGVPKRETPGTATIPGAT